MEWIKQYKRPAYALWARRSATAVSVLSASRRYFQLGPLRHALALMTFVALFTLSHLRGSDFVFGESLFLPLLILHDIVVTFRNIGDAQGRLQATQTWESLGQTHACLPNLKKLSEESDAEDSGCEDDDGQGLEGGGPLPTPRSVEYTTPDQMRRRTFLTKQHCFYVGVVLVFAFCELFLLVLHLPFLSMVAASAWSVAAAADSAGSAGDFLADLEAYAANKSRAQAIDRGAWSGVRVFSVLGALFEILYTVRRKARE